MSRAYSSVVNVFYVRSIEDPFDDRHKRILQKKNTLIFFFSSPSSSNLEKEFSLNRRLTLVHPANFVLNSLKSLRTFSSLNVFFSNDSSKESLPSLIQPMNVFSMEQRRSLDSNFQRKFDLLTNDFDIDEVFFLHRHSTSMSMKMKTNRRNFSSILSVVRSSRFGR